MIKIILAILLLTYGVLAADNNVNQSAYSECLESVYDVWIDPKTDELYEHAGDQDEFQEEEERCEELYKTK